LEQSRNSTINNLNLSKLRKFKQVLPWIGGDLQTIRDTFCLDLKSSEYVEKVCIPVNTINCETFKGEFLLGYLEIPKNHDVLSGMILITHGLGGSTKRFGLKRISRDLLNQGFVIFKLNLRGAGSGRYLSNSNYSARCSKDIIAVVDYLRNIQLGRKLKLNFKRQYFPIFGVGLSLGGTILLNACFDYDNKNKNKLLDGLACVSSPLDLKSCSHCIDRPRNKIYQKWLIHRLKNQLLQSDLNEKTFFSRINLKKSIKEIKTIREFDAKFTAPYWGYQSVDDYYEKASPIQKIKNNPNKLPYTLFIHAKDDPWVPYKPTQELDLSLKKIKNNISILITDYGGHNGFHSRQGCWSDYAVCKWINENII